MTTVQGDGFDLKFEDGVIVGIYGKILTPEITAKVYAEGTKIVKSVGVENVRGLLLDFRAVERFIAGNLPTAQSESYRLNARYSLDHIPVALIVETPMQEQMVRVSLRSTPGQERKRIVRTDDDAWTFITQWHKDKSDE
jgi:hypothetical protein